MKKTITRIMLVVLAAAMCLILASCGGPSKEDIVGTWTGSWTYNGDSISNAIAFTEDGKYAEVTYKNLSKSSTKVGTWEIDGGKVICHENGNPGGPNTTYSYSNGQLENNDHYLTKKD